MVRLSRIVRFAVNPPEADRPPSGPVRNGFAGSPSMHGLGRHYEFAVECRGEVDPSTGYFLNIADIDRAVRESLIPIVNRACADAPSQDPAALMPALARAADAALGGRLDSLAPRLSPTYSVSLETKDMASVLLRQKFEFAASHRLHVASLSDEQNRAIFGKCNNCSGHGHNYHVEPAVRIAAEGASAPGAFHLADLERITDEIIIRRFDHKHLNTDVDDFTKAGLNPSVENIAKVCFDLLAPAVRDASNNKAALASITVWETEKTSCVYPG